MKYLHERLPSGDARTREFTREIDLRSNSLGLRVLEQMRRTVDDQFFSLMENACIFIFLVIIDSKIREHRLDITTYFAIFHLD
jgi:hypothetical protein